MAPGEGDRSVEPFAKVHKANKDKPLTLAFGDGEFVLNWIPLNSQSSGGQWTLSNPRFSVSHLTGHPGLIGYFPSTQSGVWKTLERILLGRDGAAACPSRACKRLTTPGEQDEAVELEATEGSAPGKILFTWTGPIEDYENLNIFRVRDGDAIAIGSKTTPGTSTEINAGLSTDKYFAAYGTSGYSNMVGGADAVPATVTGVKSTLGSSEKKVRVVWDNTPNNEESFEIWRKLSTESEGGWTKIEDVPKDTTSKEIELPDKTKIYDIKVIAKNAAGSSADSNTVKQSGITRKSVEFGFKTGNVFSGSQTIRRDVAQTDYSGPQWYDDNGNHKIDSNVTPYSNGTVDDPEHDHLHPISVPRSTVAGDRFLTATPVVKYVGTVSLTWKLRGISSGTNGSIFEGQMNANDGQITVTAISGAPLPTTIASDEIEITWQLMTGGGTWVEVGKTKNRLYVTGAQQPGIETEIDISCSGAAGKHPGTQADDISVIDAIWSKFSGLEVRRVDGKLLTYYKDLRTNNIDSGSLLKFGDGQCGAWAKLLLDCIIIQGAYTNHSDPNSFTYHNNYVWILLEPTKDGFLINNWQFAANGRSGNASYPYIDVAANPDKGATDYLWRHADVTDQAGIEGQGHVANPASRFANHQVVAIGGKYYDPSYGKIWNGLADFETAISVYYRVTWNANNSEVDLGLDLNGDGDFLDTGIIGDKCLMQQNPNGVNLVSDPYTYTFG